MLLERVQAKVTMAEDSLGVDNDKGQHLGFLMSARQPTKGDLTMFRDNTQQARLRSTYLPLAGLSAERGKVTGQTEPLTHTTPDGRVWTFWALAPRRNSLHKDEEMVWLTDGREFLLAIVVGTKILTTLQTVGLADGEAGSQLFWGDDRGIPALADEVPAARRMISTPKVLKRTGVTDVDEIVGASAKDTEGRCTYTLTSKRASTNVDFSRTETVETTTVRAGNWCVGQVSR